MLNKTLKLVLFLGMIAIISCHKSHSRHMNKEKASVFSALKKKDTSSQAFIKNLVTQAQNIIHGRRKPQRFIEKTSKFYKSKGKSSNTKKIQPNPEVNLTKPVVPENPKFLIKNNDLILKQSMNITLPNSTFTFSTSELKETLETMKYLRTVCGEKLENCDLKEMSKIRFAKVITNEKQSQLNSSLNQTSKDQQKSSNSEKASPSQKENSQPKVIESRMKARKIGEEKSQNANPSASTIKGVNMKKKHHNVKWEKPIILHRFMEKQFADPLDADKTELEHYGHVTGNEDTLGYGEMVDPSSADDDDNSGMKATIAAVEKDENDLFNQGDSSTEESPDSDTGVSDSYNESDATIHEDHGVNGPMPGNDGMDFGNGPAVG